MKQPDTLRIVNHEHEYETVRTYRELPIPWYVYANEYKPPSRPTST